MDDAEFEARCNRLTAALDGLRDLLAGQVPGLSMKSEGVAGLADLIAAEAHILLDEPKRPRGLRIIQ
ncbi:hypothetical protein [Sphingomonas oligoaromativorans]|uniref:hypothetical protein n=1 Tax=Sphingomonas oligoaromativorans TaxID=575322 RepID=UPI00141D74F1|nr:hypothetical protein [Sphingomonas oligoaromativorans]NIJ34350.1 hypothetical protein [Sphingomonas oligoaromativorans]